MKLQSPVADPFRLAPKTFSDLILERAGSPATPGV